MIFINVAFGRFKLCTETAVFSEMKTRFYLNAAGRVKMVLKASDSLNLYQFQEKVKRKWPLSIARKWQPGMLLSGSYQILRKTVSCP
jgi:hypothetical protein